MLDSILEFITQAASSSAFIFCFCNLIIVIILLDLKPSLSIHQKSEISFSKGPNQKQETNIKSVVEKDTASLAQVVEVSHVMETEAVVDNIEIEGNDDCSNEEEENEEEEEEEDDELRRRVEEFIEKVNKGWKEELLSTSSLV
ncbi:NAD-dependent protein deacetylase HST1 [Abrus precatorius]|uniref:NAD-dependent protein deacetylase HST1 n=1 Tax=Abrus precatorius TaxID=3816 RepID=A0A8B8LUI0_ABRPR|nr:NAD-dependent protein deacetylase HST1 [Abrus precatorius]